LFRKVRTFFEFGPSTTVSAADFKAARSLLARADRGLGEFRQLQRDLCIAGATIGFMTWIWISSIVVLIGALIDAEMEHRQFRRS